MTRYIILDTETTGLDPKLGHRVIEVAGVELAGRQITGRYFHQYLNPDREIDAGAAEVHGLTWEALKDKPRFVDIVDEFLEFVDGAELVIHNAAFDIAFLDAEMIKLGRRSIAGHCCGVTDTLRLAREQFPGKRNSLDALCERFGIANAHRTLHGALLDARLLGEVYLAMTRGQESLVIDVAPTFALAVETADGRRTIRVLRATAEELAAHASCLADIDKESKGRCVWLRTTADTRESGSPGGEPQPSPAPCLPAELAVAGLGVSPPPASVTPAAAPVACAELG